MGRQRWQTRRSQHITVNCWWSLLDVSCSVHPLYRLSFCPSAQIILRLSASPNLTFSLLYHLFALSSSLGLSCYLHFFPFLSLQAMFPTLLAPASFPSFLSHPFNSVVLPPHSLSTPLYGQLLLIRSLSWKLKLNWLVRPSQSWTCT